MGILFEVEEHVAIITMSRAEKANSLDPASIRELEQAWGEVRSNQQIWAAVLTGAGDRVFCSGPDLTIPMDSRQLEEVPGGVKTRVIFDLKGINIWKPIIAAVNGHAIGSGMEMLSGTDIRIAAEHATFGLPEVKMAAVPFGGSVARLLRQIPYCHAMRLLLTGDRISAQEALRIGLVNEVLPLPQVRPRAREIARQLCSYAPATVQAIKEAAVRGLSMGLDAAYLLESLYGERAQASADAEEARRAFQGSGPPEFKGR